jgi:hypothetical protein
MRVAKSYANWMYDLTKAYQNMNGKLVVNATCKCDNCVNGVFPCGTENGKIKPHPYAGGVCFKCGGEGVIHKVIRVYTDTEFDAMERASEKAAAKKKADMEARMAAEFEEKKAKWLADNGFNADLITYIYFPDNSYEVKSDLKAAGFHFNNTLLWHIAEVPEEYADKCFAMPLDTVAEISAWGTGNYREKARQIIDTQIREHRPTCRSEWVGEEGSKISNLPVVLKGIRTYESRYGFSQVVTFMNGENIINWFTATNIEYEFGAPLLLSGTIKKHDTYNDKHTTIMTRCKLLLQD